jgi:hypothetical protein
MMTSNNLKGETFEPVQAGNFTVRVATSDEDMDAAQRMFVSW